MKRILLLIVVAILSIGIANAQTFVITQHPNFAQDDFILDFNGPNGTQTGTDIGSDGSRILSWGTLGDWVTGNVVAYYLIDGIQTSGAWNVGNTEFTTIYNSTLYIYSDAFNVDAVNRLSGDMGYVASGNNLWTGTGDISTKVQPTANPMVPTSYAYNPITMPRPAYETEPTSFKSIGDGLFNSKLSGSWGCPMLNLDWFGTYNWRYENIPNTSTSYDRQLGNAQGVVSCVPEPATFVGLLAFAPALVAVSRKRKA